MDPLPQEARYLPQCLVAGRRWAGCAAEAQTSPESESPCLKNVRRAQRPS